MKKILIVRLSSLGDIVHAIPVAAALREGFPEAGIDWMVESRHADLLRCVTALDNVIAIDSRTTPGLLRLPGQLARLRHARYDCVIDVQGLWKSSILSRMTGARRVLGFAGSLVREKGAHYLYTEQYDGTPDTQSIYAKNLALLRLLGVSTAAVRFPLAHSPGPPIHELLRSAGVGDKSGFALLVPGASKSNKRWPAEKFGRLAQILLEHHALRSAVLQGNAEEHALAIDVERAARGSAVVLPPVDLGELLAMAGSASVVVAGDTGPLHVATAAQAPVVGIYGPTDPARNGPAGRDDLCVSRHDSCRCKLARKCTAGTPCMTTIPVSEVADAVARRLSSAGFPGLSSDAGLQGQALPSRAGR